MKLSALSPRTQTIEIKLPDGTATGIKFVLRSPKNQAVREKQLLAAPLEAKLVNAVKQLSDDTVDTQASTDVLLSTAEKLLVAHAEFAAAAVVGWSGVTDDEGNQTEFNQAKLLEFFKNPENEYVLFQVSEALKDVQAFFR